jgi:ATP-binding cassette subfamily B protein
MDPLLCLPTAPPDPGVRLETGLEQPWPWGDPHGNDSGFTLLEGEVALIAALIGDQGSPLLRQCLGCFQAPCVLPLLTAPAAGLELHLRVVTTARLQPRPTGQEPTPTWLDPLALRADLEAEMRRQADRNAAFEPLDRQAERRQLAALEQEAPARRPSCPDTDPIRSVVERLCHRHGRAFVAPRQAPPQAEVRLRQMLDHVGLISRPIQLQPSALRRDCGDLVLLTPAGPLLLLSEAKGYHLWDPSRPAASPCPLRKADRAAFGSPLRALSVLPAMGRSDLHAMGLMRFAYGPASHATALLVGITSLGLAIGFLLAIGREVGAARWIAGLGGMGLLTGMGLASLSNPLRPVLIAALLSTLLGLLIPTFNTLLTNQALPDKDTGLMLQMGALLLAAAVADAGLRWSQTRSLISVQQRAAARLELASVHRLLSLPARFFQSYSTGELALRFGAIEGLQQEIRNLLSGGVLQVLLTGVYLLFLLRISVKLTGLALLLALVLLLPTVWIGRQASQLERRREEALATATGRNLELITSVAKLRLAGAEPAAARYWAESYGRGIQAGFALQARTALPGLLQTVIPPLGTLLMFILITRLGAEAARVPGLPTPNLGQLLGFLSGFGTFIGAMAGLAGLLVRAIEIPVLVERAKPLLEAEPEAAADRLDPGPLQGAVAVEAVRFRYREDGPWVLDGVSLEVEPGGFLAVVGPSGSGKSTLVRLLLGLEDPLEGSVRYDGRPLQRLRPDAVRRQIGAVPQNAALFAGSLLEVIAAGTVITPDQAWEALNQVALAEEIRALPMGLHTVLPEGGGTLSGGQRQRLAIARALVRQPRLLILDEATSALDNRSQALVSHSLEALGITRIVIAHRLSTIRQADRIVVLESGRVVQSGRFDTLMAMPGPFATMMRRQTVAGTTEEP